ADRTSFTLSDGSVVRFQGATFGTNHLLSHRTGVWSLVPAPLARLLGQTNQPQLTTRSPSAVLWWSHEGTIGRREAFVCSLLGANGFETDLTPRLVRSSTGAVVYAATGALP